MSIDSNNYKKKLLVPEGFVMPVKLSYGDIEAEPLGRKDLDEDLEAVNSSLQTIRDTRGGSWPEEELDRDFDLLDLAWHEREFRDGGSFAYVIKLKGEYVGCFYIYPIGERTVLDRDTDQYDADFSWWVTSDWLEKGLYEKVFLALKKWEGVLPFSSVLYSNKIIPGGES